MRELTRYKDEYKDLKVGDLVLDDESYEYQTVVFNAPEAEILRISCGINMDNLRNEIVKSFNKMANPGTQRQGKRSFKDLRNHLLTLMSIADLDDENFNNLSHIEIAEI